MIASILFRESKSNTMTIERKKVVNTLNDLLTRSYDAMEGYGEAGNDVSDGTLRQWLFDNAKSRQFFITELEAQIKAHGGEPDRGSSFLAGLHRVWIDFKSSNLTSADNSAVLEECIRGEERTLEDYDTILKEENFPVGVVEMLRKQRQKISKTFAALKAIEESFEVVDQ